MKTSSLTPRFIKATSPKQLERLMFKNNIVRRAYHDYQIEFCAKDGCWYAWYYADLSGSYNQEADEVQGTEQGG